MHLMSYFWKHSRMLVVVSSLLGLISGISGAAIIAWLNRGLGASQHPNITTAIQYAGLIIVTALSSFGAQAISAWVSEKAAQTLRVRLALTISEAPLRRLEEIGSSRLFVLITQEVNYICDAFIKTPELLINTVILIALLVYLGTISFTCLAVLMILLIGCIFNFVLLQRVAMRYARSSRTYWDELTAHFQALIEGSKELKLNRRWLDTFLSDAVHDTSLKCRKAGFQSELRYVSVGSINSIFYFIVTGVIAFGLPFWGHFTTKAVSSYVFVILFLRGPVSALVQIIPSLDRARISLERISALQLSPGETPLRSAVRRLPEVVQSGIRMLKIRHVYYKEEDEKHFVLGPITFTLEPGKVVFVVGGNGSGKTTFAKLLTGLYVPESGTLAVDGHRIDDSNREWYRQYFSVVFQDFYLFQQLLGLNATKDEATLSECLSKLRLDQKVRVSGGRLSTVELSKGQRKRLALFAALMEDKQIYVFDEWAADQDPEFKQIFYLEILPELKTSNKTVVVISHDDRFYHIADQIVRLEEGQLILANGTGKEAGGHLHLSEDQMQTAS